MSTLRVDYDGDFLDDLFVTDVKSHFAATPRRAEMKPTETLITAGSYRSSGGHLMGTNCSCGVNLGAGKGSFCTGFSGGHDTHVCYCDCHDTPFPALGEATS